MKRILPLFIACMLVTHITWAGRAKIDNRTQDPYVSALVVEATTGKVLIEENADAVIYPASVLKLMVLFVILEHIEAGTVQLDDMVQVTNEAARMGGSQVYLDPKEQFSIEDLLYALMVQSANDAAVALATHIGGSKNGFVSLMNNRARELGMNHTRFHSVHGLPPAQGQEPDRTTARDLAILCRELAKKPVTFTFTGTRERGFRGGEFMMRTHNHLLKSVDGTDGFKTGYFKAAGFSIAATAQRNGVRIIALVLGSKDRKVRDAKATELLARGFAMAPAVAKATPIPVVTRPREAVQGQQQETTSSPAVSPESRQSAEPETAPPSKGGIRFFLFGFITGAVSATLFFLYRSRKRPKRNRRFVR